ncbi:MAG: thiamine phosphate synthase [[Eubacterium] rectale]|nr:thiamine phosphate synthase [uncultured Agathobacter sp.]MBD8919516.1 thiamine phosphate synthase [Agathobacter rectalis]
MNKTDLKLYAITDRQWLQGARLSEHVKLAIEGGATMIQIRDKDILSTASDAGLKDEYSEALEIKKICHEHKVPLIINDNVQFAIDIDADGVHLGQDDMNPAEARKLLGTDKIIGVTAKTVEQAKKAQADGADYLGSGAVFGSTTKLNAKPMTKELLREITAAVDIPVVAIGGINADNAATLKGTGIAGIAVVGAIFASEDIKAAARKLSEICDNML